MTTHTEKVEEDMGKIIAKIPVAFWGIGITLLVQFAVIISWGVRLDTRVAAVEVASKEQSLIIESLRGQNTTTRETLVRVTERQNAQTDILKEIKESVKDLGAK